MLHRIRDLGVCAASSVLFQTLAILILFRFVWLYFYAIGQLPEAAYSNFSIFLSASDSPLLALFVVVHLVVFALFRRRITWPQIDTHCRTRSLMLICVALLTLQFATYDYNFYFDRTHAIDRILLVMLAAAVWIHPLFVHLWFVILMMIATQLHYPFEDYHWIWADKRLLFDLIVLFHCYLYVRICVRPKPHLFAALAIALTGGTYFYAGVSKMTLGPHWYSWLAENPLSNIVVSAFHNGGWLRWLGEGGIVSAANTIGLGERVLVTITLCVELAAVALFVHRRLPTVILAGAVAIHLGIVSTTGIFFWKWCVFDVFLMLWLRQWMNGHEQDRQHWMQPLWGKSTALIMTAVIVAIPLWGLPTGFGWYDSRVANYFSISATGKSGARYSLEPRFFAPYDMLFQQSRFYFLVDQRVVADTYGSVRDYRVFRALEALAPAEFETLRRQFGVNHFDIRRTRAFVRFVSRFVHNAMRRKTREVPVLTWVAPPKHFQTVAPDNNYDFQEELVSVEISYREFFYDGDRIHKLTDQAIIRMDLGDFAHAKVLQQPLNQAIWLDLTEIDDVR